MKHSKCEIECCFDKGHPKFPKFLCPRFTLCQNAAWWILVYDEVWLAYCWKPGICRHSPSNRCCCSFRTIFWLATTLIIWIKVHSIADLVGGSLLCNLSKNRPHGGALMITANLQMIYTYVYIYFFCMGFSIKIVLPFSSNRRMAMPRPMEMPLRLLRKPTRSTVALPVTRHPKRQWRR